MNFEQSVHSIKIFFCNSFNLQKNFFLQYTPLEWAAQYGQLDAVKFLIGRGAHIDEGDKWRVIQLY